MKHIYVTVLFVLCAISINAQEQEFRPVLEDGKTWTLDWDVAGGGVYHIYSEYNLNESREIDGMSFWSVSLLQRQNGEILKEAEVVRDYYMGEKNGKLYFWNGSEQQEPVLFMDFSLTAGSSIGLETIKFDEQNVRLEVTEIADTVFAGSTDHSCRRMLQVTYCIEYEPGKWAEVEKDTWVEGIGSLKYGIMFPYYFGTTGVVPSLYGCSGYYNILYNKLAPKTIALSEDEKRMVASNNDFAFNLLRAMREQKDTSIVLSPLSITFALGMLNNGAGGQTQQEINETLGFDDADAVNNFCHRMLTESNNLDQETKSLIANTIYINEGLGFYLQQPFVEKVQTYYDATPEARDFRDGQTMDVINKWASDHTMGMIKTVLDNSSFNSEAVSYLLNATYFKGAWTNKFLKDFTSEETFGNTGNKVPMMFQEEDFYYAEDENCQYISLPYGNGAYSMTVYLPREDKTLGDILNALSGQNWQDWNKNMKKERVHLKLPRFETTLDVRLNEIMQSLGIKKAFSELAEFPYFCNESVFIEQMKQSAKIKVDEEGTEAAAVTVIGAYSTGIPETYYFHANRPFLYTISEQSTGVIFFIGQYLGESGETPDGISSPSMVNGNCSMPHDLQGRRLKTEPQRGVFIKDGHKILK